MPEGLLSEINDLRRSFSLVKAKILIRKLLDVKGFDLPMASTVLRFACPKQLQIIDQRVYRFITNEEDSYKKSYNNDRKTDLYFNYLERLNEVCNIYGIPFEESDRILYQLDKEFNSDNLIRYWYVLAFLQIKF